MLVVVAHNKVLSPLLSCQLGGTLDSAEVDYLSTAPGHYVQPVLALAEGELVQILPSAAHRD